jgi:dTMP kinase
MINAYLMKFTDLDDHAVHLLFAANRWEKRYVIPYKYCGRVVAI